MRWMGLCLLALALLPLGTVAAKDPEPLTMVDGLSAKVVRGGCGPRLYFSTGTLVANGGRALFACGTSGPSFCVLRSEVAARKPGAEEWVRIAGPAALLFPELFGEEVLKKHFVSDPTAAKRRRSRGRDLVPKDEAHQKIVTSVRILCDRTGRPTAVTINFPGGGREDRTYSGWAAATKPVPIPPPCKTVVNWPPERGWGSRVEGILDGLAAKVGELKSITGDFVREKRTQLLLKPAIAKGEFRFVPGRLLWIDEEPRKSQVLITRTKMEILDPGNRRLERFSFGESKLGDYVFLGFGDSATKVFRSFRPLAFEEGDEEVRLRCQPVRGPLRGHLQQLELAFDARTGLMKEMMYRDPSGDSVTTRVSGVRTDRPLVAKDVSLDVPEGTRVLDNSGDLPWR